MTSQASRSHHSPANPSEPIRPFRLGWRAGSIAPKNWAITWISWMLFTASPLLVGYWLKLIFDHLSREDSIGWLLVGLGLTEVARWLIFVVGVYTVVVWWAKVTTLIRTNMLAGQTASGGPLQARLPASPAEATNRFSDDTREVVLWVDSWLDGLAYLVTMVIALGVMTTISPRATVVATIPAIVVVGIVSSLRPMLHRARSAERATTSGVASFLGEMFAGQLAFRLAHKQASALTELERRNAVRRRAAVRDATLTEGIDAVAESSAGIALGLALFALLPALQAGEISPGDLALILTYTAVFGGATRMIGRLIAARQQVIVAGERLSAMVTPGNPEQFVAHRPITIDPGKPGLERAPDPDRHPLETLDVQDLSAGYAENPNVIEGVSFSLRRGDFVVITGPVGSGKTTLIRALLGLLPFDEGEIRWNSALVVDPGAWFVPPQSSYVAQVPRLFSESLVDNITLGRRGIDVEQAIDLATLTPDVDDMPNGLNTVVGARGLRLSGGQAQRLAVARALATKPELLVVDDLSSALDVATEHQLWEHLDSRQSTTVIAVSQREIALDRATQVIQLTGDSVIRGSSANDPNRDLPSPPHQL